MKKFFAFVIAMAMAVAAQAAVLNLSLVGQEAVDGVYTLDPGTYQLECYVGRNPFMYDGVNYPDYDGYVVSSFDVAIEAQNAVVAQDLSGPPFAPSKFAYGSAFAGPGYRVDNMTGISLTGAGPDSLVFKGVTVTYDGGTAVISLGLNALSEYKLSTNDTAWTAMTQADLGSLTIVPEPMTMSLLGLGGLVAARRRRA